MWYMFSGSMPRYWFAIWTRCERITTATGIARRTTAAVWHCSSLQLKNECGSVTNMLKSADDTARRQLVVAYVAYRYADVGARLCRSWLKGNVPTRTKNVPTVIRETLRGDQGCSMSNIRKSVRQKWAFDCSVRSVFFGQVFVRKNRTSKPNIKCGYPQVVMVVVHHVRGGKNCGK